MMSSGTALLAGLVAVVTGIGSTAVWLSPTWTALFLALLLAAISLVIFITTRHIQIVTRQRTTEGRPSALRKNNSLRRSPQDYCLFVLGSGGHTKEMLMMMDDGFCDFHAFHRRYLISSGDKMSENHLHDYEKDLELLCREKACDPGTFDTHTVTRARRVHQPLWTTPFTALLSVLDIFPILLARPRSDAPRYPNRIYSNGPATGFFVGLAAHALKMFYLVPEESMKLIYIESWARISTLSVTGKLFFHTGIADVFLVQHQEVAAKYALRNAGELVFNARRPDI